MFSTNEITGKSKSRNCSILLRRARVLTSASTPLTNDSPQEESRIYIVKIIKNILMALRSFPRSDSVAMDTSELKIGTACWTDNREPRTKAFLLM